MSDVLNVFRMLDYKSDSISSKTVIDKEGGSITLFAFDKTQGLSKHTSPYVSTIQIVEGKAEMEIDEEKTLVVEGDMVTIPADTEFSIYAIQKVKALIVRVKSSLTQNGTNR